MPRFPGVDPGKDVDITVRDGVLTIKAERTEKKESNGRSEFSYGSFIRSVTLPAGADEDAIKASYDKGILTVSVPVTEAASGREARCGRVRRNSPIRAVPESPDIRDRHAHRETGAVMSNDKSGHVRKDWTVDISIDEHEGHTRAKARLRWRDQESVGVGLARLNPADRNVD